eukprot:2989443-Prymnesium_polylepis.1
MFTDGLAKALVCTSVPKLQIFNTALNQVRRLRPVRVRPLCSGRRVAPLARVERPPPKSGHGPAYCQA